MSKPTVNLLRIDWETRTGLAALAMAMHGASMSRPTQRQPKRLAASRWVGRFGEDASDARPIRASAPQS